MFFKQYKVAKLLGLVPLANKKKNQCVTFCWLFLYFLMVLSVLGVNLWVGVNFFLVVSQRVQKVLSLIVCTLTALTKADNWRCLLLALKPNEDNYSNKIGVIAIIIGHIMYIYILLAEVYIYSKFYSIKSLVCILLYHYKQYLQFFMMVLIYNSANILVHKYKRLNKSLEEILKVIYTSTYPSVRSVKQQLRDLKTLYKKYFRLVQDFNNIFGWLILALLANALTDIIAGIIFSLNQIDGKILFISTTVLQTVLYFVSRCFSIWADKYREWK